MKCPKCQRTMTVIGSSGPREVFRCPAGHTVTKLPQPPMGDRALRNERYRRRFYER